jgi:O-antigen ligase
LQQALAPGEVLQQEVALRAPKVPGDYSFEWDLIQENVVWFSVKNGLHTSSQVTVLPNPDMDSEPAETVATTSSAVIPPIPDRRTLWRAAAQLLLDHPLFGIGQDNFRLMHGRVYGWDVWNDTIHTNNWYIETVVSLGLLGSLPFLAWLGFLTIDLIKKVRRPAVRVEQAAVAVGLFAFFIHGLLDYFLAFHATGLLFWLLVGLWVSETREENR